MEELIPMTIDNLFDMVPIVDDDDLKEWGMYSEELLVDRYKKSKDRIKEATPPLTQKTETKMSP